MKKINNSKSADYRNKESSNYNKNTDTTTKESESYKRNTINNSRNEDNINKEKSNNITNPIKSQIFNDSKNKFDLKDFAIERKSHLKVISTVTLIIILAILSITIYSVHEKEKNSVKEIIHNKYGINISLVSKNIDENENGSYTFKLNDLPDVQFSVIKDFNNIDDDYISHISKYFFTKWKGKNIKFTTESYTAYNLFFYKIYANFTEWSEIPSVLKNISDFTKSCDGYFNKNCIWNVYIKNDDFIVAPFQNSNVNINNSTYYTEKAYLNYLYDNNIDEYNKVPQSDIDKFEKNVEGNSVTFYSKTNIIQY